MTAAIFAALATDGDSSTPAAQELGRNLAAAQQARVAARKALAPKPSRATAIGTASRAATVAETAASAMQAVADGCSPQLCARLEAIAHELGNAAMHSRWLVEELAKGGYPSLGS